MVDMVEKQLRPGYTVRLSLKIKEGKKERSQIYEGIIIKMSGSTPATKTITVRKVVKGFGVEKIIPLAMPSLESVAVLRQAKVHKSKLYYLRNYAKRVKETAVK